MCIRDSQKHHRLNIDFSPPTVKIVLARKWVLLYQKTYGLPEGEPRVILPGHDVHDPEGDSEWLPHIPSCEPLDVINCCEWVEAQTPQQPAAPLVCEEDMFIELQAVAEKGHAKAHPYLIIVVVRKPTWDNGGNSSVSKQILEQIVLVRERTLGRKVTSY